MPTIPQFRCALLVVLGLAGGATLGQEAGRADEAVAAMREALRLKEAHLGEAHPELVSPLNGLADLLLVGGDLDAAEALLERARAIGEAVPDRDALVLAFTLDGLARIAMARGDYPKARTLLERAIAINESALGPDHPDVAVGLNQLGGLLSALGLHREARPLFERALRIVEKAYDGDHEDVAAVLGNLAGVLMAEGDFLAAEPLSARALAIQERRLGKDHPAVASVLKGLAFARKGLGRLEEAESLLRRAVAIQERAHGPDHLRVASVLNDLGELLQLQGAHDEARSVLERALAIREGKLGEAHPKVAVSLSTLGNLLMNIGLFAEAQALLERAIRSLEASVGSDHPFAAAVLSTLGRCLHHQGKLADARRAYERSLEILERTLGPDHPDVAMALGNLAALRATEGAHREALRLYRRALAATERVGGYGEQVAIFLSGMAVAHFRLGEHEQALSRGQRAVALFEVSLGPEHPRLISAINNLAWAHHGLGAHDEAKATLLRALRLTERSVRLQLSVATPAERVRMLASVRWAVVNWLAFTADTGEAGYETVLHFRGLAGRVSSFERRLLRAATGDTRLRFQALRAAQARLAGIASSPPRDEDALTVWRARYGEALTRTEELALTLAKGLPAFRHLSARLDLGASDVQAQLRPGERVVDMFRYIDRYAVWVLGPEGEVERLELTDATAIDVAAAAFRRELLRAAEVTDPDLVAAGQSLRALVWEPIARHLGVEVDTVYLIPDGALATVPFSALPGRETGRLLLDDLVVVHLATAQDLVPRTDPASHGRGILALGGVDYDRAREGQPAATPEREALAMAGQPREAGTLVRTPSGTTFAPLPATRAEVEAVSRSFALAVPQERALKLVGAAATEASLRAHAPGRRIVHLATHSYVRVDLPSASSHVPTSPGSLLSDLGRNVTGYDPMLLAGLALAGANGRVGGGADDGILTAIEAADLDLDAAELVVLSSCDSAGGTAQAGEGVLGLVRGFRTAGARSIVATLWPVEDGRTLLLMKGLYARMFSPEGSRPAALALREAVRALRELEVETLDSRAGLLSGRQVRVTHRPFAAPRHWAAFVAYGPLR